MVKFRRRSFRFLAFVLPAAILMMLTVVAKADSYVDLAITSHTDSPDPVVGTNVVQYKIVVENLGITDSVDASVSTYMGEGDDAVVQTAYGSGWSCFEGEGGGYFYCDRGSIAGGATAPPIFVNVQAPNYETTITNYATVYTSSPDYNGDNNYTWESTDVIVDSNCSSSQVSCGDGHIDYASDSSVTTGKFANATKWFVGTTFFPGQLGATGGQDWSMFAKAYPGKCLIKALGLPCTFDMHLQVIPSAYTANNVQFTGICDVSHCGALVPGTVGLLLMFYFDAAGHQHALPKCPGLGGKCFTAKRLTNGDLKVVVKNIGPGDPRIAGLCAAKC